LEELFHRKIERENREGKSRGKIERENREGKSRGEIGGIGIEIPRDNSSIPQV
jgi:hypothetical protein